MTAIATWPLRRRPQAPAVVLPPLSARLQLARAVLVVCCVLCAASLAQLVIGSAVPPGRRTWEAGYHLRLILTS